MLPKAYLFPSAVPLRISDFDRGRSRCCLRLGNAVDIPGVLPGGYRF